MPIGRFKDFADCVKKNQDKKNPAAFCAQLERIIKERRKAKRGGRKSKLVADEISQYVPLTRKAINDLPDSSFAIIEPGGKKDSEGKTVPRSLRHLPFKKADGSLDLPRLRNAIARASQVKLKDGRALPETTVKRIQNMLRKRLEGTETKKVGELNKMTKDVTQNAKHPVMPVDGKCPIGMKMVRGVCFDSVSLKDMSPEQIGDVIKKMSARKTKGKMAGDSVKGDKSIFTDTSLDRLNTIIDKLEKADTVEAAKLLAIEFRSFVLDAGPKVDEPAEPAKPAEGDEPEDKPADEAAGESDALGKEELAKIEKEVADALKGNESTEPVKPAETQAVDPIRAGKDLNTQLCDALKLNEKMLNKLKEADQSIMTLEKINDKLKKDHSVLTTDLKASKNELSVYINQEEKDKKERVGEKFEKAFTKYCEFMEIPDTEKESVKKMMSTYSEDMLDNTMGYLEKKEQTVMGNEPDVQTNSSSQMENKGSTMMTKDDYNEMSAKDKTDYLFSLMHRK